MLKINQTQLQDVARIIQGGKHGLSGYNFVQSGFPAYGAGGLNGYLTSYEFDCEAIVLSSIGARCGKCFYVNGKWSSLANTQVIIPNSVDVNAKFLWFQLNDESRWPRSGTGQPFIKPSDVKDHRIVLPLIAEQQRIAAILEKADRLRRMRRYARELSETFLESVFSQMIGDPITNPMKWSYTPIDDLVTFITSGSRGWAEHYSKEGARFIRVQNLTGNQLDLTNTAYVAPPPTAETKRTAIQPADLLLAITGATIGLCALAPANIGEAYVNQHVAILRFNKEVIPTYISAFMAHSRGGQYQIATMQYGDTKPGLSLEQVRSIEVLFPPPEIQEKFAQVCRWHERFRTQQREAARQAEHLFQTLLQRAFRGEL